MENTSKKLNFEQMEEYANNLQSSFYNAMISEVVSVAVAEEQELSIEEINMIAGRLCDSDELSDLINSIIFECFDNI